MVRGVKRKPWTEEDKRAFHEQKLRASTIPGRRDNIPLPQEWEFDDSECEDSDSEGDGPSQ